MKMKKMLVLILVGSLLLSVFSGCAKSAKEQVSDSIQYTTQETTQETNQETKEDPSAKSKSSENEMSLKDSGVSVSAAEPQMDMQYSITFSEDQSIVNQSGESYKTIEDNQFFHTQEEAVSTFSIDVDTASYSNVRSLLDYGMVPEPDAIRIEEFINYFDYNYEQPKGNIPFSITTKVDDCPWQTGNKVLMVGLQGIEIPKEELPSSNIVMLIDVSGSMADANKLPLLKQAFEKLIQNLDEQDRISLVVYAGAAGVILEGADGNNEKVILSALNGLESGGSTAGGEGIELAYKVAKKYFIKDGNNRVVLATDGDFNVGISDPEELEEFIEEKKEDGIFLSVIGFGRGNIRDDIMETLADKGNGNYGYIDTLDEANKLFQKDLTGTLFAIAKDVKIQIEFNPELVAEYRLIGYENRVMENEDFEDDTKDAGELGVGHTVTALYEIVPVSGVNLENVDNDLSVVRLRYKEIDENESSEIVEKVNNHDFVDGFDKDMAWAMAVAEFGMILRGSEYKGDSNIDHVKEVVNQCLEEDYDQYRGGFLGLIGDYENLEGTYTTLD